MLEEGVDTKNLLRDYTEAKRQRDKARNEASKYKELYRGTKTKLKDKLRETLNYLKKM